MKNNNQKVNTQAGFQGFLTIKKYKSGTQELISELGPFPNKVVTSSGYGRNLLMRVLCGDTTYPVEITTASVGDGNTAPADGDTDLDNPLVTDISVSNSVASDNVATIDVFASDATLPDDTYEEFGLFCTGRLFSRILISPAYTKGAGEDTIFSYVLTATSS